MGLCFTMREGQGDWWSKCQPFVMPCPTTPFKCSDLLLQMDMTCIWLDLCQSDKLLKMTSFFGNLGW